MIPLLGVEWLTGNYKVHWFHGEALYSVLRRKYDLVTEDGVTPVRRWVGGTTEKPVYAYLVGKSKADAIGLPRESPDHDAISLAYAKWRGQQPHSPSDHTIFGAGYLAGQRGLLCQAT